MFVEYRLILISIGNEAIQELIVVDVLGRLDVEQKDMVIKL